MIELTRDEVEEVKLALAARSRAAGPLTHHHQLCQSVLLKLHQSEQSPRPPHAPSANGQQSKA